MSCQMSWTFPFVKLPTLVFYSVVEYLSPKDKATLSRVNKQFRDLMNLKKLWKGTTFAISPTRQEQCQEIVQLLLRRNASSVSFKTTGNEQIQESILKELPNLQSLSIPVIRNSAEYCTSTIVANHCKNLKRLHMWRLTEWELALFGGAIRALEHLEDLSLELCCDVDNDDIYGDFYLGGANQNISQALCSHGNLRKLELCFKRLDLLWLFKICRHNPKLKTLKVHSVVEIVAKTIHLYDVAYNYLKDLAIEELCLHDSLNTQTKRFIEHSMIALEEYPYLVSLDLSVCTCESIIKVILENLYKLPSLKHLNLTQCSIKNNMFLSNHPKLHYLELRGCYSITYEGLQRISSAMATSLKYLGLANCTLIREAGYKVLPLLFPSLDTVDLSACSNLTDEVLREIYLQPNDPVLMPSKIIAKGCKNISTEVIKIVRQRTRKLIIVTD